MTFNLAKAVLNDYLELADDSCAAILPDVLRVTVELGIPDVLRDGRMSVDELADSIACDPPSLRRLLRALAVLDLVIEKPTGFVELTVTGRRLRREDAFSVSASIRNPDSRASWLSAADSIRTGRPAFDRVRDGSYFAHKDGDAAGNRAFLRRMRERASRLYPLLPAAVDWRQSGTVMDIGGGDGFLLARVLRAAPHLRGILFDRPAVVAAADVEPPEDVAGILGRWSTRGGDFFTEIPPGADTHLMCSVLHDWSDGDSVTILGNSRRALSGDGRLLIVEMLLPEGDDPHPSVWSDLGMLVLTGGRERSGAEFAELLRESGYALHSTTSVPDSLFSIIEAHRVDVVS